MNHFTIAQLQQLSGIKAHTIRIWEKRYNALTPHRSAGNTRSYDGDQLRRLLNIVSLLDEGYKISQLGQMTDQEIQALLASRMEKSISADDQNEYYTSQLIAAAMSYDHAHFEKIYHLCVEKYGLNTTYKNILYPMLKRMGLMWGMDSISPAQEHFSSNLIKQKIFAAIDALPPAKKSGKTWLLFLPENEFHEIGLLYSHYVIREAGHKVIYLGPNVPLETLKRAQNDIGPTDLLFFFVHNISAEEANSYINSISVSFPKSKIHIAANADLLNNPDLPKKINPITAPDDLIKQLK